MGLEKVPHICDDWWVNLKNDLTEFWKDGSKLSKDHPIKEGIVIEHCNSEINRFGRKKVKLINPEYLLNKTNTDYH